MNRKKIIKLFIIPASIVLVFWLFSFDKHFELSKNIEIFTSVYRELNTYYVDEIEPGEIMKKGIDAMLKSLDPYTIFYPESDIEDARVQTTGMYGGIGSTIRKRGDYVVIAEPYEGYPAHQGGLMAGDELLEVNGKSIKGKSTNDVVKLLKGAPGTQVTVKYRRHNEEPKIVTLTRKDIKIENVPYYGILDGDIGYIKLRGFTNNAGKDVRNALIKLKDSVQIKGVILDLRGNPGGLLREAINVANVFIDKGELIASTRGKVEEWNKSYRTLNPAVDTQIPLAVLIDRGSASASEIVSGSIQDLDRGVVIGRRSFGKGLVQTTRPIKYNSQLKVTTSKYYIPSGRCIQALDYSRKNNDGSAKKLPDSLLTEFRTANGRLVYDGAGITPDVLVKNIQFHKISRSLVSNNLIFDYATEFRRKNSEIATPDKFKFTDKDYEDFIAFLSDKEYDYKTDSEAGLEVLKQTLEREKYLNRVKTELETLISRLQSQKRNDLIDFKEEIVYLLTDEIVSRYFYQKGRIILSLHRDAEVKKAIEILKNPTEYKKILSPSYKIPKQDLSDDDDDITEDISSGIDDEE